MSRVLLVGWADREEEERRTLSSGVGESEDTWECARLGDSRERVWLGCGQPEH